MDCIRQLLTACEHGDVHSVQSLLDQGVEVDAADENETTPLQVAAANGHADQIVRLLLMRGAALDKANLFGWTPLMHASRNGHVNVVALLLQHKADINAESRYGASALTLSARGGHLQVVRLLVDYGIDLNSSGSNSEFTPLLAAAQHGHDAVLRFLLDRGSEVNYRTQSTGLTPLMLSALNGHMTTAQILIERGCDPNLSNVNDKTALEVANIRGKREVRGYLERKTTNKPVIDADDIKPDIIEAAKHGDIHRIRDILDSDLSQLDASSSQDGATPLMFAAMTGRLDIAQLLVERECDINKQDTISGWTALMQATYHGKKVVAMFLINCDADVSIQAKNGCTAFDMASLIDDVDTDLLRLLAAKAMHVNKVEKVKKKRVKQNGIPATPMLTEIESEDQPKSGLKAWWNRMSNRFRNLKLGRTFNLNNRLVVPLARQTNSSQSVQDLTLKSVQSPKLPQKKLNNFMDPSQTASSITSYETMLLETKKSATLYTLDINPPHCNISETLKPVIPPFLPPPSFALDGSDRTLKPRSARQPPSSIDSGSTCTMSSTGRPILRPMKFLQSQSTGNLCSSPSSSGRFPSGSPGQGDYRQTDLFLAGHSTSSPRPVPFLPPPSSTPTPSRLFMPRYKASTMPSAFRSLPSTTSPNSSTSGSSSMTPQRSSRGKSTSSKGSTASTLTPSPSPTPGKVADESGPMLGSVHERDKRDDELSGILKKLSLEKYQPIFEEQEVDMEAFLTLTDCDLKELGISGLDSRRQILSEITELNTGKGLARQQFHETMTSFQSTLKAHSSDETGSDGANLINWKIPDVGMDSSVPGLKSRSS